MTLNTSVLAQYLQKCGSGVPQSVKMLEKFRKDGLRMKHYLIEMLGSETLEIEVTKDEAVLRKGLFDLLKTMGKGAEFITMVNTGGIFLEVGKGVVREGKQNIKLAKYLRDKYDVDIDSTAFKAFMTSRVSANWILSADPYEFVQSSGDTWGNCTHPAYSRGNAFTTLGLSEITLVAKKMSTRPIEKFPELPDVDGRFYVFVDVDNNDILASNFYGISTYSKLDVEQILNAIAYKLSEYNKVNYNDFKDTYGSDIKIHVGNQGAFYFNPPQKANLDAYYGHRKSLDSKRTFDITLHAGKCLCCGKGINNSHEGGHGCPECKSHNKDKTFCTECDTLVPTKQIVSISGEKICQVCAAKRSGVELEKCAACQGFYEKGKHKHRVKIDGKYVKLCSDACLHTKFKPCAVCGKLHSVDHKPFPYNVDIDVCSEECLRRRTNDMIAEQVSDTTKAGAMIECNNIIAEWYKENLDEEFMKNWQINAYNFVKIKELGYWQEILMAFECAVRVHHKTLLPDGQDWFYDAQSVILEEYAKIKAA